ncbi:cytochrome P450 [Periconia macrospinosa]|uniref:Cytochrome P450 n=1 Tax=Periconia macrospinosa TaxID=97972 RepID=A0A2V1DL68_9PLEO|nr:cytochrome P450 [Periconia macrospinosa]
MAPLFVPAALSIFCVAIIVPSYQVVVAHDVSNLAKVACLSAAIPIEAWAALTDLYTAYHISKGDRHIDFHQLHEKYGKIVRFGPRRISIRSAEALKDIYSTSANVKRSDVYASSAHFFGGTPSSNTTPDMKEHAFRRRVNVRALSASNIKSMEEKILRNIRYFCDQLVDEGKDGWSSPRDMSKYVGHLVSDMMGDITFSKNWEVQQKPDNRDLLVSLPEAVAGIHLRPETGDGFSTEQLVSEAGLLIAAGSDTTITATTATFFYLTHYPDSLRRVQDDIRSRFADLEDICIGPELASCRYLAACIEESLRMSPPVGSTIMREVLPGGLEVDGEWFPPKTDLGVPHYALHHDERYFPDAFTFKPERWLTEELGPAKSDGKTETSLRTNAAFSAFGVGRTSCIGRYLAYQEISLVVARTLWLYDVRIEPGSTIGEGQKSMGSGRQRKNQFQTLDRFVSTHQGPSLQFRRKLSGYY